MPATHSKSARLYKESWEKEDWAKGWLNQYKDLTTNRYDPYYGFCKLCNSKLKAKDLKKHTSGATHKSNARSAQQQSLAQCGVTREAASEAEKIKKMDIAMASCIGVHTSIRSVDHIGELVKKLGEKSLLGKLQLHRTKCTAILKNVISPSLLKDLVDDVGDGDYSIIMDESTGVSTNKYFAMMIKYHSSATNKIITDFLGMFEVHDATAVAIAASILEYLKNINLPIAHLVGIGTDGAATMCGINQSVFTEFPRENF